MTSATLCAIVLQSFVMQSFHSENSYAYQKWNVVVFKPTDLFGWKILEVVMVFWFREWTILSVMWHWSLTESYMHCYNRGQRLFCVKTNFCSKMCIRKEVKWMVVEIKLLPCSWVGCKNVAQSVSFLHKTDITCVICSLFPRTKCLLFSTVWFVVHLNRQTLWATRDYFRVCWTEHSC